MGIEKLFLGKPRYPVWGKIYQPHQYSNDRQNKDLGNDSRVFSVAVKATDIGAVKATISHLSIVAKSALKTAMMKPG